MLERTHEGGRKERRQDSVWERRKKKALSQGYEGGRICNPIDWGAGMGKEKIPVPLPAPYQE